MWSHLRTNHPAEYAVSGAKRSSGSSSVEVKKRQKSQETSKGAQRQLTHMFEQQTPFTTDSVKWKKITEKLTILIADQMLPFSLIEADSFLELIKELEPRYKPPSRNYISKTAIPEQYNKMKSRVINELRDAKYVSLTSDAWSSATMDPFLSVTAHFITSGWTMSSFCLRTIYMPESHTGENIAQMIRNILKEYNILPGAVVSITTDGGSNMVKASSELDFTRIPCFGHILHNSINESTQHDKIKETVKCVRDVVTTFSHSGHLKMELKKKQKEAGLVQTALVGETKTRWGSKYKMVDRVYTNREPIQSILLADKKFARHNPTWDNLQYMETFLVTLKPFSTLTDSLSGSKSVTISKVWPMIKLIEGTCKTAIAEDVTDECKEVSKEVRTSIWNYVDSRYKRADTGKVLDLLKICSFLDPRLIIKDEVDRVTDLLVVEVVAAELLEGGDDSDTNDESRQEETTGNPGNDEDDLMDLLMSNSASCETAAVEDADTRARKEIAYYIQTAGGMIGKKDDLLQWWSTRGNQFPLLSRAARKFLTANATSTASERNFSFAGIIVSKKRRSLKPEKIDMLTCLAYNLKSGKA